MGNLHELTAKNLYNLFGLLKFFFFFSSLWLGALIIDVAKASNSKIA